MKQKLIIFLLFVVLTVIVFCPIFLGKVNLNGNLLVSFYPPYGQNLPYKNTGWNQLRIYFPFYKVTLESFKNLLIPFWNPYVFSGHPHLADFQTAIFYPLNIFGLFLPQIEFWHLLRLTPTILAGFFTYLFLKNLKLSNLASFFGAITFGFSPFILTWGEEVVMSPHSIVWLPLILFAIDKYLKSKKRKFLTIIAFSSAFSLFGGYMQTSIYLFIFVLFYLVLRIGVKNFFLSQKSWKLALAFLLGAGIAAIQLFPSAELYFNSARSDIRLTETLFSFLLSPKSLLTYLIPDFFGHPATWNFFRPGVAQYYEGIMFVGVAALIFASLAVFTKKRGKLVVFLVIFGIISLLTTLDIPTSHLFLSLPVPFLSTSIANRVLFIPAFCLATLAAIGMQKWLSSKEKNILTAVCSFGFLYALIAVWLVGIKFLNLKVFDQAIFSSPQNIVVSLRNMAIPAAVFLITAIIIIFATLKNNYKKQAAFLIIAVAFAHIFYFSQKYISFTERKNIFPTSTLLTFISQNQGIYRSWGMGSAFLENNFASQYKIFWPEGYDSLNNRAYSEFTYAMQGNMISDFIFRADAGLGRGKSDELINNLARRKLINLVGVKYVIAKTEEQFILEKNNYKKVYQDGNFSVFENLEVIPRVFLASNYEGPPQVYSENKTERQIKKERRKLIPQKLLSDSFDLPNVLILDEPSPISPQFGKGSVEIISYKPQEVIIKTKSEEPKLLFLSDNFYPGWKAEVDGEKTGILRANYTFRAVPLIGGEHTVRFYYDSDLFKLGLITSAISLGAVVLLYFRKNRLVG